MVIVDTTVWVDYLNGRPAPHVGWLERELERQRLGLTDLILCEVLQGVRDEHQAAETRRELLKLQVFTTGGVPLAVAAAAPIKLLDVACLCARRRRAAFTVLLISMAIVSGPTPPGTGVIAPATSATPG